MSSQSADGRFVKGAPSPNPEGRPRRKKHKLWTPADFREVKLRVANEQVESRFKGETRTIPLYEANMLALGTDSVQRRIAAKNFIDMVDSAASAEAYAEYRVKLKLP